MIDLMRLERRPLSKVLVVEGYTCQQCHRWKPCWYSNRLLEEALRKLEKHNPASRSYRFHLAKAVKRAQDVQLRGMETDGAIQHQNMAGS